MNYDVPIVTGLQELYGLFANNYINACTAELNGKRRIKMKRIDITGLTVGEVGCVNIQLEACEKEHKEEVKEIFEEIEKQLTKVTGSLVKPYRFISEEDLQALKKHLA